MLNNQDYISKDKGKFKVHREINNEDINFGVYDSLEEAIIIINDNSNITNTKFNITVNSSYKISGPFTPNVDFTGPMILTI